MADFTPIRVSELPEVTNVGENDYLVVDDGIQTSKIKSKNYNERSSGSAKEYADEAARSASLSTERAEAAAQSVVQVDELVQNASASANNALNYSRDAEAWAKGTRDGSAVPITDATHENNAKYYAQQAQNSATSAAESADAAEELLVSAIDPTLTQTGKAADAKKTGDELANLSSAIEHIEPGMSDDVKTALLACFQNVAWVGDGGQAAYNALQIALYANDYHKLDVVYTAGVLPIYTDDSLATVKSRLTVTYYADSEDAGQVIPSADYTLSGTLEEGTSTLIVQYSGVRAFATIPDVVDFYNIWEWKPGDNTMTMQSMTADPNQTDETMYPSRLAGRLPYNQRRSFPVGRGKSPYYAYQQAAVAMPYYPVPIPAGANHIQIKCQSSVFFYMHTVQLDLTTLKYGNSIVNNRIMWTQITGGVIDKDIVNPGNLFMLLNSKYDAAGTSYPVDPVGVEVIFSEV